MSRGTVVAAVAAALMFVLSSGISTTWGKEPLRVPDRDYTLWGTAYVDGIPLTSADTGYTLSVRVNSAVLAFYVMGSELLSEGRYALKVPMSAGERWSGKAQSGDTAYIRINGVAITEAYLEPGHQPVTLPIKIGNPAESVEMSVYALIPPRAIDDLVALTGTNEGEVSLIWTAPGDNGDLGKAAGYIVKYFQNPITNQIEFDNATTFPQNWIPKSPGEIEHRVVTGLVAGRICYFAVEAFDNVPLQGSMSNSPVSAMSADKTPPYIVGHNPAPGSTVAINTNIYVEAKDDGIGVNQSTIQMTVKGAVVKPVIASISGGYSLTYDPPQNFAYGQEVNVTVYAADLASPSNRMDKPHSYSFKTIENKPPAVSELMIMPSKPKTGDELIASYKYYDEEQQPESDLTEIRWYKNGVLQPVYNDQNTVLSATILKGQVWHVTVRPHDGFVFGELQTSPAVTVGNTKPVASNPVISPSSPLTADDLLAVYGYSDIDGDAESNTTVRWYKNGNLQAAYNDQKVVPAAATSKGQQWRFTVRPGDGTELGEYQTSPVVTIGNTAPVANVGGVYEGKPGEMVNFNGSGSYDADGDPLTYLWDFGDGNNASDKAPLHIYPELGVYVVSLVVNDGTANSKISTTMVYIGTDPSWVQQVAVELPVGWNLISIRIKPIDSRLDSVLFSIQGKYDAIWTYDAEKGGWLKYIAGGPPSLNNLNSMRSGAGYWIKMNQTGVLMVQGIRSSESILLKPGQNLVGYNSQSYKTPGDCMSSIAGKYKSVLTYASDQKKWLWYISDGPKFLNNMEFMGPGRGYLVDIKEECWWDVKP